MVDLLSIADFSVHSSPTYMRAHLTITDCADKITRVSFLLNIKLLCIIATTRSTHLYYEGLCGSRLALFLFLSTLMRKAHFSLSENRMSCPFFLIPRFMLILCSSGFSLNFVLFLLCMKFLFV